MRIALFAASLAVAFALPADEITFHPAKDSELAKHLTLDLDLKIDELSLTMNGESMPGNELGEVIGQSLVVKLALDVTDKYGKIENGRPLELWRKYDDVTADLSFGTEDIPSEDLSQLEGKTVHFAWEEDKQAYAKSFHESTGDDEVLATLSEDMDLRVLLPEGKVSAGDTWSVPAQRLMSLFAPGFELAFGDDEDQAEIKAMQEELGSSLEQFLKEFKVVCTFKGVHADEGADIATIAFNFDGRDEIDLAGLVEKLAEVADGEGPQPDVTGALTFEFKGDGELDWNQKAGHLHDFKMHSDLSLDFDVEASMDAGGQMLEFALNSQISGKADWLLTAGK